MDEKYLYDNSKKYIFTNATDENFTGMWGGNPETIPAGESRLLEEYLAYHYAKHLTDREMMKQNKPFADKKMREEYFAKFVSEVPAGVDVMSFLKKQMQDKVNEMVADTSEDAEESVEEAPKAIAKKKSPLKKPLATDDEDTFEGLN